MDRRIEEIYANRRKVAQVELELRLKEIRTQIPKLATIDSEIANLYANIGKAKIMGEVDSEQVYKSRLDDLKEKRALIIKEKGITDDKFKLKFNCEHCNDTGYVTTLRGGVKCECLRLEEAKLLYQNSNMLSRLQRENFSTFDISIFDINKGESDLFSQRDNMEEITADVKSYIKNFGNMQGKGLVFYGGVGLGKSFLCSCIGKELIDNGKTVLYYSMYDLVKLMSKFTFEKNSYLEIYPLDDYGKLDKVDLLIIDDLGSELTNSFVISELFNVINSRIIKGKSTIVSTNLDIAGLEDKYGERLYSRFLMYFSFYKFIGDDIRRKL